MEITPELIEKVAVASAEAQEETDLSLVFTIREDWDEYHEPPTSEQLQRFYRALIQGLVRARVIPG